MSVATEALNRLRSQIQAGFLIRGPVIQNGIYSFTLPGLEADYTIGVPDSPELQEFLRSHEFENAIMRQVRIGAAVLDIVGFSQLSDEQQFLLIARYQTLVRAVIVGRPVRKLISIGDGTIFVFEEAEIPRMLEHLLAIDHELAGYNLDFGHDGLTIERRIGVHVGLAYRVRDINGEENYIGTGMNLAQRVSTLVPIGEDYKAAPFELKSTLYISQDAANAFRPGGLPYGVELGDAGTKEVKHGVYVHAYAVRRATQA
jgi:class 3 adenylate cyclase